MNINEGLTAYRLLARAEGRSPRTIEWITRSVGYFAAFLGPDRQDLAGIRVDDLRRFIIYCQEKEKWDHHPINPPQGKKLSSQSVDTYARAIRAFFGHLTREGYLDANPMAKIRMPKVVVKEVETYTARQCEKLLAQPERNKPRGYRDFAIMLTYLDTGARLSELLNLMAENVDFENGCLKVMGKGAKEHIMPFGHAAARTLLKYKTKFRPKPSGEDYFFLTSTGHRLSAGQMEKLIHDYGERAGLPRCYPHKLRHTSSVLYLRNGGDPFSLQKKLGHTSLTMTRHYANMADADVQARHLKYGVGDRLNL